MTTTHITEYTDEELTTRYRNAWTTACQARGSCKTERNEDASTCYRKELERRGLPVPTEEGAFNGVGSV
jgi:hypothetical protein